MWTAAGTSSLGDGMVLVAFPLLALSYTHRPVLIAGVAVAGTLPAFLVALPAGALADRVNRRRLLVGAELARLALLGGFGALILEGWANLAVLYVTVFVLKGLGVVFDITSGAALPSVVAPSLLFKANANLLTAQTVTQEIAGQALGGIAFAASAWVPFVTDAATFAASAGLLRKAIPDNPLAGPNSSFRTDLRDGIRWFVRLPLLRRLTGLISSLAFCQALVIGMMVIYGVEDLHMSRAGYGLLLGVSAVGTAVTAAAASQIHARLGTGWCIVAAGIAASSAYPILALTRSPVTAGGALALEASGVVLGNIAARSLRQSIVPPELQGRVASTYQMAVRSAVPLGGLTGGLLVQQIGVRHTFLFAGLLQLAVVTITAPRLLAAIRRSTGSTDPTKQPLAA